MRIFTICMIAMLSFGFALFALAADKPTAPPDGLKLEKMKQPVVFNHSTHSKGECVTCHHPVAGNTDFRPCATAGCHDVFDRKDKTEKSYFSIMHGKDLKHPSCISCHVRFAGDDPEKKKKLTACKNAACHTGSGGAS